jgi:hypothetical protein
MFQDDIHFLEQYTKVIVLKDNTGNGQIAICPEYQGRIMTSSAGGSKGLGFGWINRNFISSRRKDPQINLYGGEDRFWLGPEGGQFSLFFKSGSPFDIKHWITPAAIDSEPYEIVVQSKDHLVVAKRMSLNNYSNETFSVNVQRELRILPTDSISNYIGIQPDPLLKVVSFQSENTITNTGMNPWTKQKGLISIWILGMFNPSQATTIAIPFRSGAESDLGPVVNDDYFGKVPADRLIVKERMLFFRGDGKYRSKIGLSQKRAKPMIGSFDSENSILTIVQYTLPKHIKPYVNSMWKIQKDPFNGDIVNSYNDGPLTQGKKQLGPFYELESSSPGAQLKPGESLTHIHRTIHIQGCMNLLDPIARETLGIGLDEIAFIFQS